MKRKVSEDRLTDVLKDYATFQVVRALEARVARLEQFHCEHEFSKRDKGCLESIFCSKCGALRPGWELVPQDAMVADYDSMPGYTVRKPVEKAAICVKNVWYRPVRAVAKGKVAK